MAERFVAQKEISHLRRVGYYAAAAGRRQDREPIILLRRISVGRRAFSRARAIIRGPSFPLSRCRIRPQITAPGASPSHPRRSSGVLSGGGRAGHYTILQTSKSPPGTAGGRAAAAAAGMPVLCSVVCVRRAPRRESTNNALWPAPAGSPAPQRTPRNSSSSRCSGYRSRALGSALSSPFSAGPYFFPAALLSADAVKPRAFV